MSEVKKYVLNVNAFEVGVLTAIISESGRKDLLKDVFKQLLDLRNKFREEAGVKVEHLGKGMVKLTDKDGNMIVRKMYEWEK